MKKIIEFENHSVEIDTSAGWLFVYRNHFGRDILPDIMPALESTLTIALDALRKMDLDEITAESLAKAMDQDLLEETYTKLAGAELITVYRIFWAAAKNADKQIPAVEEYFNTFETFPLDVIIPQLFASILDSSISSKNVKSLLARVKAQSRSTSTASLSLASTEG
ncbi:MAG: hypothetical protein IJ061_06565 [Lachnospiraceae bacterium]|nr:hypothetical protein [Lachnospiraceae bacterium]